MTFTRYRPLADYALIGNNRTAALVARDGSIDFACLPHFDDPPVFWRLLDADRGGYFRVGPLGRSDTERRYLDDAAVLETVHTTDRGRCRVLDFMHGDAIYRSIEGLGGAVALEVDLRAAPALGDTPIPPLVMTCGGARLVAAAEGCLRRRFEVGAGERRWCVLAPAQVCDADADAALAATLARWRAWMANVHYDGPYQAAVRRSAQVLGLLTFEPTGAIVAAPTTSLPEAIGGTRNWDYRYCWLRDAAMVVRSLIAVDHHDAARAYFRWLEKRSGRPLAVAYTIDGEPVPPEREQPQIAGYRGSRPVRTGNAAAEQVQLDIYGHLAEAIHACATTLDDLEPGTARFLAGIADEAAARWTEPDAGIWEVRHRPAHHVSSKLLCWLALDRTLELARAGQLQGDVATWLAAREEVRVAILDRGYHADTGAFTQSFGGRAVDASALLVPLVRFLPGDDPRVVSTIAQVRARLGSGPLIRRYAIDDGLPGADHAFTACSFWLVQALALAGDLDAAHDVFDGVLAYANDLGLFAEEIDPGSGDLVGNFPQGYAHLALIGAATTLRHVACLRAAHAGSRSASPLDHPPQRRARSPHRLVPRRGAT